MKEKRSEASLLALMEAEKEAASQLINFVRGFGITPGVAVTSAVERAMELSGANMEPYRNIRRRIEAKIILWECISRVDRHELPAIETALMDIAEK